MCVCVCFKYILHFIECKIFYASFYFAKDVEDWFGYVK